MRGDPDLREAWGSALRGLPDLLETRASIEGGPKPHRMWEGKQDVEDVEDLEAEAEVEA